MPCSFSRLSLLYKKGGKREGNRQKSEGEEIEKKKKDRELFSALK